jgi:PIN domain nuclease of toxin-antitoxin system
MGCFEMILLDTHVWLRWLRLGSGPLPKTLVDFIEETENVSVSAVSVWEAAWLVRGGRIELKSAWEDWLKLALQDAEVGVEPMTAEIAGCAAWLPIHHRDPADRFIIATAIKTDSRLLSLDATFPLYTELAGRLIQA